MHVEENSGYDITYDENERETIANEQIYEYAMDE